MNPVKAFGESPRAGTFGSWSRLPLTGPRAVRRLGAGDLSSALGGEGHLLPFGSGRTYGDTCVSPGGTVLSTATLDRILNFDVDRGIVTCESGVRLEQILDIVVSQGWFLPVCPGTRVVTVGGAIAHDVHGKNQHRVGNFGCWVERITLMRSCGEVLELSADARPELFHATIGGLGLTGLIVNATIRLRSVESAHFMGTRERRIGWQGLIEERSEDGAEEYELWWVDTLRGGEPGEHCVRIAGDHAGQSERGPDAGSVARRPTLARWLPAWVLRPGPMRWFNRAYFLAASSRGARPTAWPYTKFLFPQDDMHPSNRMYGRRGVYAHHALIPMQHAAVAIPRLLARAADREQPSLVTVLKRFGELRSPGMLSFQGPGVSIVTGFNNVGQGTLNLLADLDSIVAEFGGRLYPAKDARMPAEMFRRSFPRWEEFARHVDPRFVSRFWQRVSA